ncbi:MAG: hypothetical protein HY928_11745 [Elusimicrobia bacterium]|nr:hypothetical protein [Elusimicrobiota bacterium]
MSPNLALAALLLAAAPAAAADEPGPEDVTAYLARRTDLGPKFSAAWRRMLKTQPGLRESYRFVESQQRVDLRFPGGGEGFGEATIAIYNEGLVRINRRWLGKGGAALEAKGVPYAKVPEILAWKALPVLVHELRHGITEGEMQAELGKVCGDYVVEDEVVAFRDQVAAIKYLLSLRLPAFHDALFVDTDHASASILQSWELGPDAYLQDIRERYDRKLSAMTTPRAELLEASRTLIEEARGNLALWRGKDPAARAQLKAEFGPDPLPRLKERMRHEEDCLAVFSDDELYERWVRFFSERVEAVSEDWAAER